MPRTCSTGAPTSQPTHGGRRRAPPRDPASGPARAPPGAWPVWQDDGVPNPSWPSGRERPGRRAVLGAGVAAGATALLAGCGVRVGSPAGPATPAPAGPDELARERVARDADALLALVTRVAAARPTDRALLRAVAADHRAHAAALRPSAAPNPSSPVTPGPGSASTGSLSTGGLSTGSPSTGPALTARDAL